MGHDFEDIAVKHLRRPLITNSKRGVYNAISV